MTNTTVSIQTLPIIFQTSITNELRQAGIKGENLNRALSGRLCDIEDTIDIKKYVRYLGDKEMNQAKHFKGRLSIGDELYFNEKLADLIFDEELDHDYLLVVTENEEHEVINAEIHFFKKPARFISYEDDRIYYPPFCELTSKELGCDTASFLFCANGDGEEISTLADGYYGEVFTIDGGEEHLFLLTVSTDATSLKDFKHTIQAVLESAQ
ncbi:hypothetical protein LG296_21150 (plasmid) [Ureibacillus chungkukjangi]|uniref:hypothetical protein n=1 Tax=Ureibacillus chungkukjangi TaxID=1202712 RepID=UPI000D3A434D|nr:hypothetical protein [Ureibacillus chungkukjangi]MCM3390196.1 hypothetical protein [Ureibacillus chungkukjangi]